MKKILLLLSLISFQIFINAMENQGLPNSESRTSSRAKRKSEVSDKKNRSHKKLKNDDNTIHINPRLFSAFFFKLISNNNIESVEQLLTQFNMLVRIRNEHGETPLIYAIKHNHIRLAYVLLKYDTNINECDNDGNTALIHAAKRNCAELADYLIYKNAKLDIQNSSGRTALMESAFHVNEVSTILLRHNASASLRDSDGNTASDIALHTYYRIFREQKENSERWSIYQLMRNNIFTAKALFNPGDDIKSTLINLIYCENKKIMIAVYLLKDRDIVQALNHARRNGVEIELLIHDDLIPDRSEMIKNEILIWVYKPDNSELMHNKFCIFEDNIAHKSLLWNGSYNFTFTASTSNQENVMIQDNLELIDQYKKRFEFLKKHSVSVRRISNSI